MGLSAMMPGTKTATDKVCVFFALHENKAKRKVASAAAHIDFFIMNYLLPVNIVLYKTFVKCMDAV